MNTNPILRTFRLAVFATAAIACIPHATATPQLDPEGPLEAAELIQMELYHDSLMKGSDISISVENKIAVLTGTAVSIAQAERAATRAYCSPDVLAVADNIRIKPGDGEKMAGIALRKLRGMAGLSSGKIKVELDGSTLVLTGEAGSVDEAEMAREMVSEVPGVQAVRNRLVVNFESVRTDKDLAAQLIFMTKDDPLFSGLDLSVKVKDGVATWSGQVGSKGEFDRLLRNSYVTGVIEVVMSGITVNEDLAMEAVEDKDYTPAQIIEAFDAAIVLHPEIGKDSLRAEILDGVVKLTGVVPSANAAVAAERTASAIPGVSGVMNEIRIMRSAQIASTRN